MRHKKAKFFCENCGAEVPENAKVCKKCGKFFISVRCPGCGKTGNSKDFEKGCPFCGYAASPAQSNNLHGSGKAIISALKNYFTGFGKPSFLHINTKNYAHDDSLPIWIYIITALMFCAIIFYALIFMKKTL